jgi:bifunctional non-homologous end joining protein LigD
MAFQRKKPAAVGVRAPFPGFIEPALATSAEKVPFGERWIQGFHPARQRLDQALS